MELYTNSNAKSDFLRTALEKNIKENEDIYIATAFFNYSDFIKKAVEKKCNIKLIVRISLATLMQRLKEILQMSNVNIRFFTSDKFHPKLYIFGNSIAFIGSSNLTQSGLTSNQEINISIEAENPIFDDLKSLFDEYWEQAEVLDNNYIQKFIEIEDKYMKKADKEEKNYQSDIKEIKECGFSNITIIEKKKRNKEDTFISDFKKKYQVFLSNYIKLENIYKSFGQRKNNSLLLKIEIDQFLSWIREKEAKGNTFKISKLSDNEIKERVNKLFKSFCNDEYISEEYIENYNFCIDNLSQSKIDNISKDDLYKSLSFINALRTSERYLGGDTNMRKEKFFENSNIDKIKKTIKYLF